ncbi:MAG: hypothetical protein C5B49_07180 [Bdellovibrio sp.]|nr:MAG: hypothetical protein C5B49_07180 [Bdellovibrio sp.]
MEIRCMSRWRRDFARVGYYIMMFLTTFFTLTLTSCRCDRQSDGPLFLNSRTLDGRSIEWGPETEFLIVNFWASWCAPCVAETPSLFRLVAENHNRINLISISEDESEKSLRKFLSLYPNSSAPGIFLLYDQDRKLSESMDVHQFPESFIYSRDLKLLKKVVGAVDWAQLDFTGR